MTDGDRVYPGDGVAPLADILRTLREIGFDGYLSIELFNPTYWKQDPLEVGARSGLQKLRLRSRRRREIGGGWGNAPVGVFWGVAPATRYDGWRSRSRGDTI